MKTNHVIIEKTGRRWMGWGLVAIPFAGFALLAASSKGPESQPAAAPEPVVIRKTTVRPAKPASVVKATTAIEQAARDKPAKPRHIETEPASGLSKQDTPARPKSADSLKRPPEHQRPVAVMPQEQAMALRGTPDDIIGLIKMYHEAPSDEFRDEIFSAACNLSNPDSAGLLLHLLQVSGEPDITTIAELALARMADSTLLDHIIHQYETTSDPNEQAKMLGIIYQVRSPSRVPALIDMAEQQPDGEVASVLRQTLGMIGSPEAVGYLLDRLVSAGEPEEQATYSEALSWVVEANALPLLVATAAGETESRAARVAAVRALGNFAPENVERLLGTMAATESDAAIRQAAAQALERVRQFSL
jgi:HEAT repeat protein